MFTTRKAVTRLAIVALVSLLALSLMPPALGAPPVPTAPSITLEPASGAPGSQVVVRGSGFATGPFSMIELHWGNNLSPLIGTGPAVAPDGTFNAIATIPPNATPGPHSIVAYDSGTANQASAPFNVAGASLRAAYIYNTDQTTAGEFQGLLEGRGMMSTTLVALGNVPSTDLAPYSLLIIGPDTGFQGDWGSKEAVTKIRDSGKPILGLGDGGYAFFGKLYLHIGYPHGGQTEGTELQPVDFSYMVYQSPYSGFSTPLTVYGLSSGFVSIYLPKATANAFRLGRWASTNYYSLVQESGRYLLWGFDGGPISYEMTLQGECLFVNVAWYLLRYRWDIDTLILTDYQRMQDIGYSAADVSTLQTKINTLVAMPSSQSKMTAVVKRLNLDTPASVQTARTTWDSDENSVAYTNSYVAAIDSYIESLKQGTYPRLEYIILVGAHEVIPMKARDTDDMEDHPERIWALLLPEWSGYLYSLYRAAGANELGHYLTDSIYGDLPYVDNGYGVDNELIPELPVGRLVETPSQISMLLENYMASKGTLARSDVAAIGSWDYKDGAQAAAYYMGAAADTTLIQDGFESSLVPPKINAKNDIVYIGGHGDYNWMTTRTWDQGFMAGSTASQGDTEELNNMPNAVVVASGCHNGVNLGNKLYHDYTGDTTYGDFPERFANKGVGIYLGSTGYTWISATGSSNTIPWTGWSELLAAYFLHHLLNDGRLVTAGRAFKAAVNEYVNDYGGVGDPHRRVLAIATLYGIPNYGWQQPLHVAPPWPLVGYSLQTQWLAGPYTSTVTLAITNWSVGPDGLIVVPAASHTGDYDEPILPVVRTQTVLPAGSSIVGINCDESQSESTTINNDVPLASMAVLSTTIPNPFSYVGFYPPTPTYSITVSTLGGNSVEVGLNIVPVQYNQATHQTRVWTRMVCVVQYEVDPDGLAIDSDGDGLLDYWESGYGLNPNDATGDQGAAGDPDQDGLTNAEERDRHTNPLDPDTDHDGSNDGLEVRFGTDPLNPGSRVSVVYLPVSARGFSGTTLGR